MKSSAARRALDEDEELEFQEEKVRQISTASAKDVDMAFGLGQGDEVKSGGAKKDGKMLAIVFFAMVFIGLGNKVFQKLETLPMRNYPNFLNLLTTFVYLPVCFAYIVPAVRYGLIPKAQTDLSKKSFAVMGGLDGIAGIMQTFAATYLGGPLLILLGQSAIPVSMVISKYLLKAKYSGFQYIGALVVVGGILVVLAPTITGSGSVLWSAMMIASALPTALSTVYKEIALGETELDPIYLNGWIAVFQFGFSLMLCIPASLTSTPPVPIPDLPSSLWGGMKCYAGINTITCGEGESESDCVPDDCSRAPLFVNLYLLFNQVYNLLIILIIKFGSANLLFLALTINVPLGNCVFTLNFVPDHKPLQVTTIIGLVLICLGLVCYRFADTFFQKIIPGSRGKNDSSTGIDRKPLLSSIQRDEDRI
jgi:drug/metabolite transporter (DMT)-like permease